ncbi:MAG: hypothetical protein QM500_13960 [Methylococcales bacterium]
MQKLVDGNWVDVIEADLNAGDTYRISVGGGWEQKQYSAPMPDPIQIVITGMTGDVLHSSDFSKATIYEETNVTITGTLAIPDQNFAVPIRRNDGRLFIFLAEVAGGAFSFVLNFPTCGTFIYSDSECNKDLPYNMFTVNTINFDVLRKITL